MSVTTALPATPNRKLRTREVCVRYSISDRTLQRWIENAGLEFPKPVSINSRNFFDETALDEWDEVMAARSREVIRK
jgi:excisionase family DNA binding protein